MIDPIAVERWKDANRPLMSRFLSLTYKAEDEGLTEEEKAETLRLDAQISAEFCKFLDDVKTRPGSGL